jgi:hypothetical protein
VTANIEHWRIRSQFVGDDAWTHEAIVSGPPTPRDEFVEVVRADLYAGAVEALEAIRKLGAVCDQYETCEHRACRDSYAAWATADQYLGGSKPMTPCEP